MDFRRKTLNEQMKDFDIVQRLDGDTVQKKYKLHIQFKDWSNIHVATQAILISILEQTESTLAQFEILLL